MTAPLRSSRISWACRPWSRRRSNSPVNDQQSHADAPEPETRPSPTGKNKDAQALKKLAFASIPRRKTSEKLTMELPGYLIDDLKQEAVNRRTTARHLVMLALQSVGFHIDPADLVPYAPRRKSGKK